MVHPGYGPSVIKGIERRQVIGEEKRYYVIDMLTGGTTLMTPVAQAKNVGLRPALSNAEVKRLLRVALDVRSRASARAAGPIRSSPGARMTIHIMANRAVGSNHHRLDRRKRMAVYIIVQKSRAKGAVKVSIFESIIKYPDVS